jgi:NitT/TauT family transport system ATP-binding protein
VRTKSARYVDHAVHPRPGTDRVIVLSRPPSRILMDQSIDFPEPRDVFSIRETEAYAHYYQAIWKVLGQEFRAAGMTR